MPQTAFPALALAWTGTLAFAASLLWFVYSYLVRFGDVEPDGARLAPVVIDVALFSAFALHHSVLARSSVKAPLTALLPVGLERSTYTWVASLLFIAVCTWWQAVPGLLYHLDGAARVLAWSLQALGIVLTVRASNALDILDLAGVRQLQRATGSAAQKPPPTLTTRGLYGFVRHPLYFSWALFVFATPAMTGTRAAFAIISTGYLMLAIPWEERGLVATFGPEYEAYRQRVRTRMIPFVY
jgi:protein-S-isoprenylcysteine O-methyltransferase Ste14